MSAASNTVVAAALAALALAAARPAASAEAYCDKQRGVCHTLCGQVTPPATSKRIACDTGCERSVMMCQSTGSFSFTAIEQFMPEFHRQQ
ncbi:MAG: hypothetical protein P4L82_07260 [Ancalomicrobiaceae bacterium]|nr:hypothetical protein [Ancalomicrobiaceae bacterium]